MINKIVASLRAALPFLALLTVAWAGYADSPAWLAIGLSAAILFFGGLHRYVELWPRAIEASAQDQWLYTLGLSAFNAVGASAAAFVSGGLTRWFWG